MASSNASLHYALAIELWVAIIWIARIAA